VVSSTLQTIGPQVTNLTTVY